jgi:DNA-binding CsgD family transcriptional regulator
VGVLLDRVQESAELDRMLAAIRDGLSSVLVLRGEAGIGKSALLDYTADHASDMQLARVIGVESEMDLSFAALHQLLIQFLDGIGRLPAPQRDALGTAFGRVEGPPPDRFLVGLATLTLLTDAAAERPILCVVDDAQWLDRVSVEVLGFVARRLFADRVGMLFAVREDERVPAVLEGLPQLRVSGLPGDEAGALLARSAGLPLEERVSQRIVAETGGNPLALLEFGGELTADERSGSVPLYPLRFGGRLERLYLSRIRDLPEPARMLVLLAAADPSGEPAVLWRAADELGIDASTAESPAVDRLVIWEPTVRFRHPLMRSAAYYAAPLAARRRAHAALAHATDPVRDPDRRAWHLADAANGPDEQVAVALEQSAGRARARGGWVSGAVFLQRAAELTPEADRRVERLLDASAARLLVGEAGLARKLAEEATPLVADCLTRARAQRLEGLTLFAEGSPESTRALLDAARAFGPAEPRQARDTLLDAFGAAQSPGQSGGAAGTVLRAVRDAPPAPGGQETLADFLLDGFAAMAEQRYADGAPLLRRAMAALTGGQSVTDEVTRHFMAICLAAALLYDNSVLEAVERRWAAEFRDRGAIASLLVALVYQAAWLTDAGQFPDAEIALAEGRSLAEATGHSGQFGVFEAVELRLLAARGEAERTRALADRIAARSAGQGSGMETLHLHLTLGKLSLGAGDYEAALRHLLAARSDHEVLGMASAADVAEAAVRSGDRGAGDDALAAFTPLAQASGTPTILGLLARARALLAGDDAAEPEYQRAIEYLRQERVPLELARSHLVYGEWLRRQRRRRDARDQLRTAFTMFDQMGMAAFARRAAGELRATGEHANSRKAGQREALTPQEEQIARLASSGASNSEIAARLFISASTVDYHLHKVYRKLGINSRVRLIHALDED